MMALLLCLLIASLAANGLGIVYTIRDAPAGVARDGRPYFQGADNTWQRTRAPILLALGLFLNTAAGILAVVTAAAPAA